MESSNAEERPHQCENESDSSFEKLSLSSSLTDSSYITLSSTDCTDCDYENVITTRSHIRVKKKIAKVKKLLMPHFSLLPHKKNVKSYKTNEVSQKTVAKSKSEVLKNYCPYSSDNCGCSSGCTDCDYGLHTYTVKNKKKLKNKAKKLYVRASNGFTPLKASERSRRTAKSLNTKNILRKKKTRFPKKKALDLSCDPESSGSCDYKSSYIKHDCKLGNPRSSTKNREEDIGKNFRKTENNENCENSEVEQ